MTHQPQTLADLSTAAARAAAAYKWGEAIAHYSEALAHPDLPPETAYSLRDGRAAAYRYLGDFTAEQADLAEMALLAETLSDPARQVAALARQVEALRDLGELMAAQAK